jgi:hypothetical protein
MHTMKLRNLNLPLVAIALWTICTPAFAQAPAASTPAASATAQDAASGVVRQLGTVKAVAGNHVTMTTDAGAEVSVEVQDSARMVRTLPGQKDLKGATAITLQDIHPGDRMLARGKMAEDGKALQASSLVVMTGADIARRQQQELQDWKQRGVGGLVKSVDPATKTVAISTLGATGTTTIAVHTTDATTFRRYAPDSVKFDDATKSSFDQIKPGDQLRALGNRNPDNTEVTADEIVFGTFQNLSGTISSIDTEGHTIAFNDLATKKPVTVGIAPDSQMRKLPPMVAQRIATRLKGGTIDAAAQGAPAGQASGEAARQGAGQADRGASDTGASGGPGARGPRGDMQEMLSRLPAITLGDLQKGDVVMMVATEGSAKSAPAAVTLLTGVEPILTASPKGSGQAGMLLSPWNLGTASAEAGAAQ